MIDILIGTSGFSYNDWKGDFYPHGMAPKNFLEYYSYYFNVIELNFSYYRIPQQDQIQLMLDQSGGRVEFVVKAFRQMTHENSGSDKILSDIVSLFIKGISPLIEADKLGGILLQFPQHFHYTHKNRIYLKSLIESFQPLHVFVEFRQKEWLKESVYNSLTDLGAGFVCVDEPDLPALIPPFGLSTSDTGYIRFHGRNSKNWYGTDSTRRYDYLYSEMELEEWVPRIERMEKEIKKLFVFFNNHARAQAVDNARMLISLLNSVSLLKEF